MNKELNDKLTIYIENIVNDNKLEEIDKIRIKNNVDFLEYNNFVNPKKIIYTITNNTSKIKSVSEIVDKLLIYYTLATFATYSLDKSSNLINATYKVLNNKFNIESIFKNDDLVLVEEILKKNISEIKLNYYSSLYERVYVFLWALGYLDSLDSSKECNIKKINRVIFTIKDKNSLINNSKIRSKKEILDMSDLIIRYMSINNKRLNKSVVNEQYNALMWLTSNEKVEEKVICVNNNLSFSFIKNINLIVEESNEKNQLLLISNKNYTKSIIFYDLGVSNGNNVELDQKLCDEEGFTLIKEYSLTSDNLPDNIIHNILRKDNDILNIYYVTVNNHILKIESSLENSILYKKYTDLINSKDFNIDLDILLSIKEEKDYKKKDTSSEQIKKVYDFSNVLSSNKNINQIIEYFNYVYSSFDESLEKMNNIDKTYLTGLNVYILFNSYKILSFDNHLALLNKMFNSRLLKDVRIIEIELNLCYKKMNENFNNRFKVTIKPFNIKLTRESNHIETAIDKIEKNIYNYLNILPKEDTIFSSDEYENQEKE